MLRNTLLFIPAFNEEACLPMLLREIADEAPELDVLVVSDGSTDDTVAIARENGAAVLDLPYNMGVGGAVQAGLSYGVRRGYRYAVRCDADGQHPPGEIGLLLGVLRDPEVDVAIGSRFLGEGVQTTTWVRSSGIRFLSMFLSRICRAPVSDPTSGFQAFNRLAMTYFAGCYPTDYPEPEALAVMRRQGFVFREVGVSFRERQAGETSIRGWDTVYYAFKVLLALCVDRARPLDSRRSRHALADKAIARTRWNDNQPLPLSAKAMVIESANTEFSETGD